MSPFSEEMLSAYLDGEATSEERELIEQLLEDEPELQEQLSALKEVSQTVQSLPKISAPADFAESVLAEIKQRQNSNSVAPNAQNGNPQPAKPVKQPVSRSGFRTLRAWSTAVCTLFVLGVTLIWLNSSQGVSSLFQNASGDLGGPAQSQRESSWLSWRNAEPAPASNVSSATADRVSTFEEQAASMEMADESAMAGSALAVLDAPSASPTIVPLTAELIKQHLQSLSDSPTEGDQLSILTNHDETPLLVDLTVVDVKESWGKLQYLLENHKVQAIGDQNKVPADKFAANNQLIAVYLDIEEPQMESVLNELPAVSSQVFFADESTTESQPTAESNLVSGALTIPNNLTMKNRNGDLNESAVHARQGVGAFGGAKQEQVRRNQSEQQFRYELPILKRSLANPRGKHQPDATSTPANYYILSVAQSNEQLDVIAEGNGKPDSPPSAPVAAPLELSTTRPGGSLAQEEKPSAKLVAQPATRGALPPPAETSEQKATSGVKEKDLADAPKSVSNDAVLSEQKSRRMRAVIILRPEAR